MQTTISGSMVTHATSTTLASTIINIVLHLKIFLIYYWFLKNVPDHHFLIITYQVNFHYSKIQAIKLRNQISREHLMLWKEF